MILDFPLTLETKLRLYGNDVVSSSFLTEEDMQEFMDSFIVLFEPEGDFYE